MKNWHSKFLALSGLIALTACRTDFALDVYTSDAFAEKNLLTPAVMRAEISSCSSDNRRDYERNVLSLFTESSEPKIIGCSEEGMNSLLEIGFMAEVTSNSSNADIVLVRNKMDNYEFEGKSYEHMSILLSIHSDFLERVDNLMERNYEILSYEDIDIKFNINNDLDADVLVTTFVAWVDGEPYMSYSRVPLKRREKISIQTSKVISDLTLRGELPVAFYLTRVAQ